MIAVALSSFLLIILNVLSYNNKTKLIESTLFLLSSILGLGLIWLPFLLYQNVQIFPLTIVILCISLFFMDTIFQIQFLWKVFLVFLACAAIYFFSENIVIFEYNFYTNNFVWLILFLGSLLLLEPLAKFGERLLKFFIEIDTDTLAYFRMILLGIAVLIAYFKFSYFGIAGVLSTFIIQNFIYNDNHSFESYSILFVSLGFSLWLLSYKAEIGLFEGATIFTLFNTLGLYLLFKRFSESINVSKVYFAILFIASLLLCSPLFLGTIYPMFGGMEYYIFSILLVALLSQQMTSWNQRDTTFLFSIFTFIGILFYLNKGTNSEKTEDTSRIIEFKEKVWQGNDEFEEISNNSFSDILTSDSTTNTKDANNDNKSKNKEKSKSKDAKTNGFIGNFKIKSSPVEFNFELGPVNSRTKGRFKSVNGLVALYTDINKCKFDISIPVKSLTTNDEMRDEILMDSDFFNEKKFSKIYFKSESFKLKKNYYELRGKMTMLGITKQLVIKLKYEKNKKINGKEYPVLSGLGNIDRTLFGMEPDASIGNIVDFSFKILLEKQ